MFRSDFARIISTYKHIVLLPCQAVRKWFLGLEVYSIYKTWANKDKTLGSISKALKQNIIAAYPSCFVVLTIYKTIW